MDDGFGRARETVFASSYPSQCLGSHSHFKQRKGFDSSKDWFINPLAGSLDYVLFISLFQIEALNRAVEAVKLEQQRLDNELEFICSQQRELEDCLIPLEKELAGNAVTDPEREHT